MIMRIILLTHNHTSMLPHSILKPNPTTWIDSKFAVHLNMRSHAGGVMLFGRGMIYCKLNKRTLLFLYQEQHGSRSDR